MRAIAFKGQNRGVKYGRSSDHDRNDRLVQIDFTCYSKLNPLGKLNNEGDLFRSGVEGASHAEQTALYHVQPRRPHTNAIRYIYLTLPPSTPSVPSPLLPPPKSLFFPSIHYWIETVKRNVYLSSPVCPIVSDLHTSV